MSRWQCGEKYKDHFKQERQYGCLQQRDQPWLGRCPFCGQYVRCTAVKDVPEPGKGTLGAGLENFKFAERWPTKVPAFDHVLQAWTGPDSKPVGVEGLVPGHLILIGGPKGIGKTTLLVQIARGFSSTGRGVVFAQGEDTKDSVLAYAYRLGMTSDEGRNVSILGMNGHVEEIIAEMLRTKADLGIIDSLQTADVNTSDAGEGSAGQVNAVMQRLNNWAKTHHRCFIIVSHLIKSGDFGGTETGKHLADVLMRFDDVVENDRDGNPLPIEKCKYRELAIAEGKHRGGEVDVSSFMEMTKLGLKAATRSKLIHLVPR